MISWSDSISKRSLWRYVNRKINRAIHHYHVFGVMTILFEEIVKDLKQGKEIDIFNLGVLSLHQTKPRKYYDFRYQKVMQSKGRRILKFKLSSSVNKKLRKLLDIEKTFSTLDIRNKDN